VKCEQDSDFYKSLEKGQGWDDVKAGRMLLKLSYVEACVVGRLSVNEAAQETE
jgi:hypothetical protein